VLSLHHIAAAPTRPLLEDLAEAQLIFRDLTVDEYTLARAIASEDFSAGTTTLLCLGDVACNAAADERRTVHDYATRGNGYGAQGDGSPKRPISTARPPAPRHVHAAIALLRGPRLPFFGLRLPLRPPARGIARGATRFFSPSAQEALHKQRGVGDYCPPLAHLKRWTYALKVVSRNNGDCQLGTVRGSGQLEWVGPIKGVDPWRQMFMRPATGAQDALYAEARRVIETRGAYQGRDPIGVSDVVAVLALVGASFLMTRGGAA
jgi:hypothetical protein